MFVDVVSSSPSDGSVVVAVGFVVKILPLLIVPLDVVVVCRCGQNEEWIVAFRFCWRSRVVGWCIGAIVLYHPMDLS